MGHGAWGMGWARAGQRPLVHPACSGPRQTPAPPLPPAITLSVHGKDPPHTTHTPTPCVQPDTLSRSLSPSAAHRLSLLPPLAHAQSPGPSPGRLQSRPAPTQESTQAPPNTQEAGRAMVCGPPLTIFPSPAQRPQPTRTSLAPSQPTRNQPRRTRTTSRSPLSPHPFLHFPELKSSARLCRPHPPSVSQPF